MISEYDLRVLATGKRSEHASEWANLQAVFPPAAPAAERVTYFVSATYATPSGRMAHWSGRMASASGDILADAERLIRKYRKVAGKLDIRAAPIRV